MANGDKAAAKGIAVVPATKAHSLGYDDINRVADAIADEIDARALADSQKQNALGFVPVRQTSDMTIGWRFQDAANTGSGYPRLIVLIGGNEYEVPILLDLVGAEARLNDRMNRNGLRT
jgi:hypothetical protein